MSETLVASPELKLLLTFLTTLMSFSLAWAGAGADAGLVEARGGGRGQATARPETVLVVVVGRVELSVVLRSSKMSMTDIFLAWQLSAWQVLGPGWEEQGGTWQVVREVWGRTLSRGSLRLAGSKVMGEVEVDTWCLGVDLADVLAEDEMERWCLLLLLAGWRVWVEAACVLVLGGGRVAE